jgi:hypothetical protein
MDNVVAQNLSIVSALKVYYLNDKGLHDFEKRMIISELLGGGGGGGCPSSPGCYGPG